MVGEGGEEECGLTSWYSTAVPPQKCPKENQDLNTCCFSPAHQSPISKPFHHLPFLNNLFHFKKRGKWLINLLLNSVDTAVPTAVALW